jgi:hypothetical protein
VTTVDNHYEFLGLKPTASHEEIETAIEHVSEQAIALVYTSPQRSSDLWERIRQMRRDLLATAEGRQVYDEALLRREKLTGNARTASAGTATNFRQPVEPEPSPLLVPAPAATLLAFSPTPEDEGPRGIAWPYALVAAAAVFVAVVGALLAHGPGGSPIRRPVAMTLSQLGARHSSKFVSGGFVTLAWTKVPRASLYRVQIATAPGDPTDAAVFAHGSKIVTVSAPQYHLKVTGPQLYYWRVRAIVGGRLQRYTRSLHFSVDRPRITRPVALAPLTGIGKGGKHARLCWSPVLGAVSYRLRVQGQGTRTVHGTCITLSVRPRTYHWSVAALVKGVGVYTGSYSVAAVLHIRAAHRATRKSGTHHATRHVSTKRARGRGSSAAATHHKSSQSVEVAIAFQRHAASRSTRTKSRSKVTALNRTARAVGVVRKTSTKAARASTTTVSGGAAGAKPGSTPVHITSIPGHRTPSKTRTPVSPTSVPNPPSTPTKRHTPVVASRVPSPPAPPTAPTSGAAATVTAPTRGVATTGAASSTAPIYVRPIVAPQIATNTPRSPTATSASPNVHTTSPAPTNTTTTSPASTPDQSSSHQHPAHPEHPAHPTHPDQPTHP